MIDEERIKLFDQKIAEIMPRIKEIINSADLEFVISIQEKRSENKEILRGISSNIDETSRVATNLTFSFKGVLQSMAPSEVRPVDILQTIVNVLKESNQ